MKTYKEIGDELGVTAASVQQMCDRAIEKLRRKSRLKEILEAFQGIASASSPAQNCADIGELTPDEKKKRAIKRKERTPKICNVCGRRFWAIRASSGSCSVYCRKVRKSERDKASYHNRKVTK